jgi:isoquinoline 1-oxidoreductase beta subunit
MLAEQKLTRRNLLLSTAAIAGGFALSVKVPAIRAAAKFPTVGTPFPGLSLPEDFSAWLAILEDDTVVVRCPMPEIGNGVLTQVGMTIAEELRCDVTRLAPEFTSPERDALDNGVFSNAITSSSLAFFCGRSTDALRTKAMLQAGASARERLKAAAAAEWGVPVAEVTAENSVLSHKSGKSLRFGEVAVAATKIELDAEPELKPESEWTILGKTEPGKLQNAQIVQGQIVYGIDVIVPGMKYAALMQCPVQGGSLVSYDESAIKGMPGDPKVIVVDPTEKRIDPLVPPAYGPVAWPMWGVAVVADHYWQARKALEALPIEWDLGDGAKWTDDAALKEYAFSRIESGEIEPTVTIGDQTAIDSSEVISAEYFTPYCDNAMLEPLNGTALVTDDGVDFWFSMQNQAQYWSVVSQEAEMAPEKTRLHQTFVGGAFGRHNWGDEGYMITAVAKKMKGTPVHVIWSREETFAQGRYRDAMASRLSAVLGEDGYPVAIKAESVAGPLAGYYSHPMLMGLIPNATAAWENINTHILTGPYRGPGYNSASFMIESFTDELAAAAGVDPLEYRLNLYSKWVDPGWVKVLETIKEKAAWGKELPAGQAQGVAICNWAADLQAEPPFFGSTIACVAHVEVTKDGTLTVHSLDVAFDLGKVMNRDAVLAQLQGGTLFGLNMSVNEGLTLDNGAFVEKNFDNYPVFRMADVPDVNIHFEGLSGDDRFSETGEVGVGPVGPAIANAIFAATGKRVRSTPFRSEDLSWS